MIKLKDGTEWPEEDYHAQQALKYGWTRWEAKSYLLIQNYQANHKINLSGKS